jgi:hypothetical protein
LNFNASMVIDIELIRKKLNSIFCNCDRKDTEITWYQNWSLNQINQSCELNISGGEKRKIKLFSIFVIDQIISPNFFF